MTLRARAYALLDLHSHEHAATRMRAFLVALNLLGIASVSVGTIDGAGPAARAVAATVTGIVATVFLVEYLVRLWVAPEIPHIGTASETGARLRWAVSLEGLIDLVARVPLFAELGAVAIADIVTRLRSRTYPGGAYVVRKGAPGDAMYFIVSGEAAVRLAGQVKTLREGDFFGEMALLDRKPRSADVVTQAPCTLLVLEVADFYQLASQQPALIAAIEAEAKRRRVVPG